MFRAIRFLLMSYNLALKVPWFIPLHIFLCEMGGGGCIWKKERVYNDRRFEADKRCRNQLKNHLDSTGAEQWNTTFTWRLHESILADEPCLMLIFKLRPIFLLG